MIVLWVVSILFPEAKKIFDGNSMSLVSSGGWMLGAADSMQQETSVELHVACPANVDRLINLEGERIHYHLYKGPMLHDWTWNDSIFDELYESISPDLIHIWGSEYGCDMAALRASRGRPLVVSTQGFIHLCARHQLDGLSLKTVLMVGRVRNNGILRELVDAYRRGKMEKDIFRKTKYVIGRTEYDKNVVLHINPAIQYFHCDESLRDVFYEGEWSYELCKPHRIFLSNGSTPNKGLHQILKVLPMIIKKYPDTELIVAGKSILDLANSGDTYAKLIMGIIRTKNLSSKITFLGNIDAIEMKNQMLIANAFLLPSAVENSSNALGEAQLLGVPVIASRRGGTPSMIPNECCGQMYSYYNIKQLYKKICNCFESSLIFDNTRMRSIARDRHDRKRNHQILINIYNRIIGVKN